MVSFFVLSFFVIVNFLCEFFLDESSKPSSENKPLKVCCRGKRLEVQIVRELRLKKVKVGKMIGVTAS